MKDLYGKGDRGPGVPEAIPRGLQRLGAELGPETLDRIWVFPPLVSGRAESGLLAVSRYVESEDPDRRVLITLPYSAERSGKGLTLESTLVEQGEAPLDRFPRVMEGVVRRAESDLGEAVEMEIEGDPERFLACLEEFDPELLDPALPPLADPADAQVAEVEAAAPAGPEAGGPPALDPAQSPEPSADDDMYDLYAPEAVP